MSTTVLTHQQEILLALTAPEILRSNLSQINNAPADICVAQTRVIECEAALAAFDQGEMAVAREALEMEILGASLAAPQDGKNAEQRKVQLEQFIAKCPGVVSAKGRLRNVEKQRLTLEFDVNMAKAALAEERDTFRAALAAVELKTALIRNGE